MMPQYIASVIRKHFTHGLFWVLVESLIGFILVAVKVEWILHIAAIVLLIACAMAVIHLVVLCIQLIFACIAFATGIGWHEKALTPKQLKRSVLADGVQEQLTFGVKVKYWKAPFSKRYVEEVIND